MCVCVALSLIFGGFIEVGISGQGMCSGLVARGEERMGAYFGRSSPGFILPAALARYYRVSVPLSERNPETPTAADSLAYAG